MDELLLSCLPAPFEVEAALGALLDEAFVVLAAVAAGFTAAFLVPVASSSSEASPPKLVMKVISPAFCGDRDLERELDWALKGL